MGRVHVLNDPPCQGQEHGGDGWKPLGDVPVPRVDAVRRAAGGNTRSLLSST